MASYEPFVSVIVPVWNDSERLKSCLDALAIQSFPASRREIIVVDNGGDLPESAVAGRDGVRLLRETTPSAYAARNRGVSHAKGEILAFTDSDCIPSARWIERGARKLLSSRDIGFVGGRVEIFFRGPKPTALELYDKTFYLRQDIYVRERNFAATANLFTTRRVMEEAGPFDAKLRSGGDIDWGARVRAKGYLAEYAADAAVMHPAVASFGAFWRRSRRLSGGLCGLERSRRPGRGLKAGSRALRRVFFGENLRPVEIAKVLTVEALARAAMAAERIRLLFSKTPVR